MSQQPAMEPNGIHHHENHEIKLVGAIGKRKRDDEDEGEDMEGVVQDRKSADANEKPRDQRKLIQSCFEVLQSYVLPFRWRDYAAPIAFPLFWHFH